MPTTRRRGRLETEEPPVSLDLEEITNEVRQKMEWLESVKASKARNEGALAQLVEQLQNDHGVSTLEEALAQLERRRRMESRLLERLNGQLAELHTIEERVRNATTESGTSGRPVPF